MQATLSLVSELENALKDGSPDKRVATLRRITDLFLHDSDRLNEQQIAVFDDVLLHLVQRIESKALVELSKSLAPLTNAPVEVVRRLANDDEIAVAQPVLTRSSCLTDSDLIQIAKSKGQGHLLAISARSSLAEAVTDVLIARGDRQVVHQLAENSQARFSELGYGSIVKTATQDGTLAEQLALRLDIPPQLLKELLSRATDIVRSRLLASASPEKRDQIQNVLTGIANDVSRKVVKQRDFSASESLVQKLNRNGKLNEKVLFNFISEGKYEEMTSTIALFCSAPVELIERLMKHVQPEGLLIACKTAKLSWHTVCALLKARFPHHSVSEQELDEARSSFITLSQATAQRTFRFMLVQQNTKHPA